MGKQLIYNVLREGGMTRAAALGMLVNIEAESGCVSYRLQGDFSQGFQRSIEYTREVDTGAISKNDFIHNAPGGGGYGLCQWTYYTRKNALYDFALMNIASVGDELMQAKFILYEMERDYYSLFRYLKNTNNIFEATMRICGEYESPAGSETREGLMALASYRYKTYSPDCSFVTDGAIDDNPSDVAKDNDNVCNDDSCPIDFGSTDSCDITVRKLRRGDKGRDVLIMQTGINDMGCDCGVADGDFGQRTEAAVKEFQRNSNLPDNGIWGQDEWQILFQ